MKNSTALTDAEDIYIMGYERGYDAGFDAGYEEALHEMKRSVKHSARELSEKAQIFLFGQDESVSKRLRKKM